MTKKSDVQNKIQTSLCVVDQYLSVRSICFLIWVVVVSLKWRETGSPDLTRSSMKRGVKYGDWPSPMIRWTCMAYNKVGSNFAIWKHCPEQVTNKVRWLQTIVATAILSPGRTARSSVSPRPEQMSRSFTSVIDEWPFQDHVPSVAMVPKLCHPKTWTMNVQRRGYPSILKLSYTRTMKVESQGFPQFHSETTFSRPPCHWNYCIDSKLCLSGPQQSTCREKSSPRARFHFSSQF